MDDNDDAGHATETANLASSRAMLTIDEGTGLPPTMLTRFAKMVDLVSYHVDGYVVMEDDTSVRSLVHAFLFHYEYFYKPSVDPACGIIGHKMVAGSNECSHGDSCSYMLAYMFFVDYIDYMNGNDYGVRALCPRDCGCGFLHQSTHLSASYGRSMNIGGANLFTPAFFEGLEAITHRQRNLPRKTKRIFMATKGRPKGSQMMITVNDDSIFLKAKEVGRNADGSMSVPAPKSKSAYPAAAAFPSLLDEYTDDLGEALSK